MYDYLMGKVVEKTPTRVLIDVGGMGFAAEVSLRTSERLPSPGNVTRLLVHHKVQDDRFRLFGFADEEERQLFLALIGVAGVGPAHALALLSSREPGGLWECIRAGDAATLARARGIGPKTAQRVCNELADRARRMEPHPTSGTAASAAPSPLLEDAVSALLVLGYSDAQARRAVSKASGRVGEGAEVGALIREALKDS